MAAARAVSQDIRSNLFWGHSLDGGVLDWEPIHVALLPDGTISFQPTKAAEQEATIGPLAAKGGLRAGEFLLGADWRQPFTVAPWAPTHRPASIARQSSLPALDGSGKLGKEAPPGKEKLFPFSLSYVPLATQTGPGGQDTTSYRTVMLAAASGRERGLWLKMLERKARTPGLRGAAASPSIAPAEKAMIVPPERRCLMTVGEELSGLASAAGAQSALKTPAPVNARLMAGHSGLWDRRSRFRIVRDLYDDYAADPVAANPLTRSPPSSQQKARQTPPATPGTGDAATMTSVASTSSSAGKAPAAENRHMQFFVSYVKKQAHIERLLEETWQRGSPLDLRVPKGPTALASAAAKRPQAWRQKPRRPMSRSGTEPGPLQPSTEEDTTSPGGALEPAPSWLPCLSMSTSNMVYSDTGLLSNKKWSGGAIFALPAVQGTSSDTILGFTFTVQPQQPLDRYPTLLGLVPEGADVNRVNLHTSGGGIFLCLGGQGVVPGGPCIFTPSACQMVNLPHAVPTGGRFSLHFHAQAQPQLSFSIEDEAGEVLGLAQPEIEDIVLNGWRPCVLLSHPDTMVHVAYAEGNPDA
mmetsp:Transcript_45134/g.104567  ORF Transcript_45134/g.104567 Transcript_45134/m.104567 type:complete len:582 (-) Transcript_45134:33-1778(-)